MSILWVGLSQKTLAGRGLNHAYINLEKGIFLSFPKFLGQTLHIRTQALPWSNRVLIWVQDVSVPLTLALCSSTFEELFLPPLSVLVPSKGLHGLSYKDNEKIILLIRDFLLLTKGDASTEFSMFEKKCWSLQHWNSIQKTKIDSLNPSFHENRWGKRETEASLFEASKSL